MNRPAHRSGHCAPVARGRILATVLLALCPLAVLAAPAAAVGCTDENAGLTLPPGFCASVFADGIGHARHLVVSAAGVVYVNTWSGSYFPKAPPPPGGFLVALKDTTGSGRADVVRRFGPSVKDGAAGGTGIGIFAGRLYAESNDQIVRYPLPAGAIEPAGAAQVVVSGLPLGGDHPMHPFAIDTAGGLYVDVASSTNACQRRNRTLESPGAEPCAELRTRGGIWRFDAAKTGQAFGPGARYATGLRNAEGLAVDAAGARIFVTQHGRDQLHANWPTRYPMEAEATLPAEELLLLEPGHDYGWPQCYYDPARGSLVLAPEYGGDGRLVGACATKTGPVAAFPAHWAPNAIVYYSATQFPARYRGGVFIAFHGSWNRAPYAQGGYNVVFQPLSGASATGACEIFADGFAGPVAAPDEAAHRPSGVAVGPDGALYVADDVKGRIYRIVYRGATDADAAAARGAPCPSLTAPAGPVVVRAQAGTPGQGVVPAERLPVPRRATREMVLLGERVYRGEVGGAPCTGCHGGRATGTPLGPDLTANRWVWSDGSYAGIAATIRTGVVQPRNYRSAMPAMGGAALTTAEVSAVAAYVWALSQPAP